MADQDRLQFEASAYLQTLIGRELIRNQEAAVVELVKNAYDSGARSVLVRITPATERHPGSIEVIDDGSGMDIPTLRKIFMVAGYSERPEEVGESNRVPTGEKGIGRFASDRLGTRLLVETKTSGKSEGVVVEIDWTAFSNRKKHFIEISAPYYRRPIPAIPKDSSGTRLTITGLREDWDRRAIQSLRGTLSELLNPFEAPAEFVIELNITGSPSLSGPVQSTPVEDADFDLRFSIKPGGVVERKLRTAGNTTTQDKAVTFDAEPLEGLFGRFEYYIKRPSSRQVHGRTAGVVVYRDGFRVEPFGSSRADWLGIGEKRAKRAGHAHIVPSRLFGFVSISRTKDRKSVV